MHINGSPISSDIQDHGSDLTPKRRGELPVRGSGTQLWEDTGRLDKAWAITSKNQSRELVAIQRRLAISRDAER